MVRTKRVQRNHIIDGAYKLIIKDGFKKFHARNIAQQIPCSTQPIYREFENLSELKAVLTSRVLAKYTDFLDDHLPQSLDQLTNVIVDYSLDYPEEFQRFFLQDNDTMIQIKETTKKYFDQLDLKHTYDNTQVFDFYWQYIIGKAALAGQDRYYANCDERSQELVKLLLDN